jgi:hypothetical protein
MKTWEFEKFRFELDETEFRVFADSFGAKLVLANKSRVLKLSEVSSINLTPIGGAFASGLGLLDFSDTYAVTKIAFKKKSAAIAEEIFTALSEACPSAVAQIKEAKVEDKAAKANAKEEERAAALGQYGRKICGEVIQNGILMSRVSIYEKGYVKIGSNFEKLRHASGETFVNKKTGLGRSVATLATFATPLPGFNLFSPGQRGRISLTLITDQGTRNFSTDQVHESAVRNYERLLGAAKSVIGQSDDGEAVLKKLLSNTSDLSSQLKNLSELHAQGALTDKEFAKAKAKLIDPS